MKIRTFPFCPKKLFATRRSITMPAPQFCIVVGERRMVHLAMARLAISRRTPASAISAQSSFHPTLGYVVNDADAMGRFSGVEEMMKDAKTATRRSIGALDTQMAIFPLVTSSYVIGNAAIIHWAPAGSAQGATIEPL